MFGGPGGKNIQCSKCLFKWCQLEYIYEHMLIESDSPLTPFFTMRRSIIFGPFDLPWVDLPRRFPPCQIQFPERLPPVFLHLLAKTPSFKVERAEVKKKWIETHRERENATAERREVDTLKISIPERRPARVTWLSWLVSVDSSSKLTQNPQNGGPTGDFSIGHSNLPGFSTCQYDPCWGYSPRHVPNAAWLYQSPSLLLLSPLVSCKKCKTQTQGSKQTPKADPPKIFGLGWFRATTNSHKILAY